MMMDPTKLKERMRAIAVWKRGTQRAPHKPLLLLYALGKCLRSEPRMISYAEVDRVLHDLLLEYGPERKSYHPEYPFWRLQNDGIWELSTVKGLELRRGNTDAKRSELLKHGVAGGFTEEIYNLLCADTHLIFECALEILSQHFPSTLYEDILGAVGLDLRLAQTLRRPRDPEFRIRVLRAYEYRCAVCGYDVRLGDRELALEAAHIKWHEAGGPDTEPNGLALCALHHRLFDRGAFTLAAGVTISVSQFAHGTRGFSEWLLSFHGAPLRQSQDPSYAPRAEFVRWHQREVFRSPARLSPKTDTEPATPASTAL